MRRAKRTIAIIALTTTLVSCSSPTVPATTPTDFSEPVRIYATTAMHPLLVDLATAYNETQASLILEIETANYRVLVERMKLDEQVYTLTNHLDSNSTLWAAPVGQTATVIITHKDVNIEDLTLSQLRAIFQGRIMNWEELGLVPQEIVVLSREDGSGIRAEFDRMVMGRSRTSAQARLVTTSSQMVMNVSLTPGAIGYISPGYISENVHILSIEGIEPIPQTVNESRYPLRSTIYVAGLKQPTGSMQDFISWMQSPVGQEIINRRYGRLIDPIIDGS